MTDGEFILMKCGPEGVSSSVPYEHLAAARNALRQGGDAGDE